MMAPPPISRLIVFALLVTPAWATSAACHNTTISTGWTCIDGHTEWGTGLTTTTLSPINGSSVQAGDLIVAWANLAVSSWTTQTITITDNNGLTLTQWSRGLNSFSNPANQWVGALYWG